MRRLVTLLIAGTLLIQATGCHRGSVDKSASSSAIHVDDSRHAGVALQAAERASASIATVRDSGPGSAAGPIFVLEDRHNSVTVRLEQAIALVRLYRDRNLRCVGIEGLAAGEVLKPRWFHTLPDAAMIKPGVAVAQLSQGEINAGELMALVFPDCQVVGLDDAELYRVQPPSEGLAGLGGCLLEIAASSLTPAEQAKVARLMEHDQELGFDYLMKCDPWVAERYSRLQADPFSVSTETVRNVYEEVAQRAEEMSIEVPESCRGQMAEERTFFAAATGRTDAMVRKVLELPSVKSGLPVAMLIGTAHANRTAEKLRSARVDFALISPDSLSSGEGELSDLSSDSYARKLDMLPVRKEGLGSLLAERLPKPVIEEGWFESKGKLCYAAARMGQLGTSSGFPPRAQDVDELSKAAGVAIDPASVQRYQDQVVFSALVPTDEGDYKKVYCRTAKVGAINVTDQSVPDATETLLRAELDRAKSAGHTNVELVTPDTVAFFADSMDGVMKGL